MNVKNMNVKDMETASPSRPWGLVLTPEGRAAYAEFFFSPEMAGAVIARLNDVRPYSNGSARPHLWFRTKRDALACRDIIIARTGRIDAAAVKHR